LLVPTLPFSFSLLSAILIAFGFHSDLREFHCQGQSKSFVAEKTWKTIAFTSISERGARGVYLMQRFSCQKHSLNSITLIATNREITNYEINL